MSRQQVSKKEDESSRELVFSRLFDAPRELVWKAWTDPKRIIQWWGPIGFTTTTSKMDVKEGGVWRFVMHGPDGRDYENKITYDEVVKPERLVYRHGGDEKELEPVRFQVTVTFEEKGNQTQVTMRMVFPTASQRDFVIREYKADEGGMQTLARLAEHVESKQEEPQFTISRVFDAPRELVWKAWTVPALMAQWWGPKDFTVEHCTLDLRPGGTYHYGMKSPEGYEIWGKFTYREVNAPKKLVFVSCFSDAKGGTTRHPMSPVWPLEMLSTITFEEQGGKTTVTVKWRPLGASEEERKAFTEGMASMQQGWGGTFDKLSAWCAGQKPRVTVQVTRHFDVSAEKVFDAWLDPKTAGGWLFATPGGKMLQVDIDAKIGGKFMIVEQRGDAQAVHFGEYKAIERPKYLAFTFAVPGFPETLVKIDIRPEDKGCQLTLTHEQVIADYEPQTRDGWAGILEKLASKLKA